MIASQTAPAPALVRIAENYSTADAERDRRGKRRELLRSRYRMLDHAARLLPGERIAHCQRTVAPMCAHVRVNFDPADGRASFANLELCESYSCPYCALWKGEQARCELSAALAGAQREGLHPMLLTLTLQHNLGDRLSLVYERLNQAWRCLWNGRAGMALRDRGAIVGRVRAVELTYGRSGWHPHIHALLFSELELSGAHLAEYERDLAQQWRSILQHIGGEADLEHGCKLQTASSAIADYLAKFGREPSEQRGWYADSELAKAPAKRAAAGGLSPLQLLGAAAGIAEDLASFEALTGARGRAAADRAGALYVQYFLCFKGDHRLRWSHGLRKLLQVDELLQEAAEEAAPEQITLAEIAWDEEGWRRLLELADGRAELLALAGCADPFAVGLWLARRQIKAKVPDEAYAWYWQHRSQLPAPLTEDYELQLDPGAPAQSSIIVQIPML